jgi:hypothetical protein
MSISNSCMLLNHQAMDILESSQPGNSMGNPIIAEDAEMVVEDIGGTKEQDEPKIKLNEDDLRQVLEVNSNKCIEHMRINPKEASRFDIPLCRMIYMPLVRPTLEYDIKHLEAEFSHGYRHGASIFYVTLCNERGEERAVSEAEMRNWDPL